MKKILCGSIAVIIVLQLLLSFCAFAAETEVLFENAGARELIYIEEYDVYVMVGSKGMYVSSDGMTWNRKASCDKNETLTDIAYGNDMGILIKNSAEAQTVLVTDAGLNQSETVYPVTTDGEKYYNLVLRPDIIYDPYTKSFLCGGLEVRTTGYTNIGLYRSASEVETALLPDGKKGKRMVWEKLDLGEYDLYDGKGTYNTSMDFVYTPMVTDGNGHFAFGRIRAASGNLNKFSDRLTDAANYLRLLIVMDETGEEITANRFNIGGIYTGVTMDEYGHLMYSKENESVNGSIFVHDFEKTLGYKKDVANGGTEIKNVNGRLAIVYANTLASNGKYLLSVPRQYKETTAAYPQNDIQVISYNGEALKGTSTTLINNTETVKKILSAGDSKWTCKIVAGKNDKFVMATGMSGYYSSTSKPTKVFCFDLSKENINSAEAESDEADRSSIVTEATTASRGVSALALNAKGGAVAIGDAVSVTSEVTDCDGDVVDEEVEYSVIDASDNAETYLDFGNISESGALNVKTDVLDGADVWVKLLARSKENPWLFAVEKLELTITCPVTADVSASKTEGFAADEKVTVTASVKNTSTKGFEGYMVCFVKDGYKYSDFVIKALNIPAKNSVADLDMSFTPNADSCTNGTLKYYILEKNTMSIIGNK